MSYRTILVPLEQPETAASAIEAAFLLARRYHGHVHGLAMRPNLDHPAIYSLVATRMSTKAARSGLDAVRASAEREVQRQTGELRALFEAAAARSGAAMRAAPDEAQQPSASWEEVTAFGSALVAERGRVFDLTVLGRRGAGGGAHDTVQAALLETGRPLLLTPPEPPATIGEVTLIAWNGSAQAARAVASALPLLQAARAITIMAVGNGPQPKPSGEDLAHALAWHGIRAESRWIEQGGRRVRDILLAEAAALNADLLVIGAYSHSRMRQVVFGGVTEHVLDRVALPVLMTH
jgi:nucleotide-binding universal stress UspA family protein